MAKLGRPRIKKSDIVDDYKRYYARDFILEAYQKLAQAVLNLYEEDLEDQKKEIRKSFEVFVKYFFSDNSPRKIARVINSCKAVEDEVENYKHLDNYKESDIYIFWKTLAEEELTHGPNRSRSCKRCKKNY